mmetsp:Transcript_79328/g.131360  ORF Transcript_79328/g.131360 Transcript_79328/m.131360 type:complete len:310 (+) Transcript_79328:100-1029(+)
MVSSRCNWLPWCLCHLCMSLSVHGFCQRCISDEDSESLNFVQHSSQRILRDSPDSPDFPDSPQVPPQVLQEADIAGPELREPVDELEPEGFLPTPFREALVVSIDPEKYKIAEADLKDQGVPAEMVRGFKGKDPKELLEALDLLTKYGNTARLHQTVNNWMVCMHTSPGKLPNFSAANSEFWRNLFRSNPRNVSELLERDEHNCVPKVIAIAAAHVRLWKKTGRGQLANPDRFASLGRESLVSGHGRGCRSLPEVAEADGSRASFVASRCRCGEALFFWTLAQRRCSPISEQIRPQGPLTLSFSSESSQ